MSLEERYAQATADAAQKQAALLCSAAAVKERISPARLKQDARQKIADGMSNGSAYVTAQVQERPVAAGAAVGALLLYMFRRPLWALFRRTYVRITNHTPETAEADHG